MQNLQSPESLTNQAKDVAEEAKGVDPDNRDSSFFEMIAADTDQQKADGESITQVTSSLFESQNSSSNIVSSDSQMVPSVIDQQPQSEEPITKGGDPVRSIEELMALLSNQASSVQRIVIDGKTYEIDVTSIINKGKQGVQEIVSPSDLSTEQIPTITQGQTSSATSNIQPQAAVPNQPLIVPVAISVLPVVLQPTTAPPKAFNFGAMKMLQNVTGQPNTMMSNLNTFGQFPASNEPSIQKALPNQPEVSSLNIESGVIKREQEERKKDEQNILRPSGREKDQEIVQSPPASLQRCTSELAPEILNQRLIVDETKMKRKGPQSGIGGATGVSLNFNNSMMHRQNEELKESQISLQEEVQKLKSIQKELSNFVIQHFSQKNISTGIQDLGILEILSQAQMSHAKVHLAFLFSSPLVKLDGNDRVQEMVAIDHGQEFNGVLEGLNNTGMKINYMKVQATVDKITDTLSEGPVAIHFSGHGIRGQKSQNKYSHQILNPQSEGYLVLEDKTAQAQYFQEKLLRNLLVTQGIKPDFVFVASCHSQFAGNIFHEAGAKHVICVQENSQISDEASIYFSKIFYQQLFSQCKTVCEAFNIAKSTLQSHSVKAVANEAYKFMLLVEKEQEDDSSMHDIAFQGMQCQKKRKAHQCRIFGPFTPGKATDVALGVAAQQAFRVETSKAEDFIGRTTEMHQVILCVMERRIVNVMGVPGIGKTTLVKAVAHYLDERKSFREGIIILSLRNLDQVSMILTRLELIINKKLPPQQTPTTVVTDEKLVLDKIVGFLKDKEILLILDNAETTSKKDPRKFQELIQTLLDHCHQLKFLFTSRYNIGSFENNAEKVIELKELQLKYAVQLLKQKAPREILSSEIEELLRIKPDKVLHSNPMLKSTQGNSKQCLETHHMFHILNGHPHAISLAAPLLQNKRLRELYELLNSDEIMNWLEHQGNKDNPMASLKVSMDISINQLKETEPEAINLFWLIGLLPGGCTPNELDSLWGSAWLSIAEKLLRSSLLVKKNLVEESLYQLFPFMNQYASQNMRPEDKALYHSKITKHYTNICKELLKEQLEARVTKLVSIETNIWACIYRARDKGTNDQHQALDPLSRARSPGLSSFNRGNTPLSMKPSSGTSMSNHSEISSSQTSGRQPQQASSQTINTDTTKQYYDEEESTDNDKYDSILSQQINFGFNKERSKSEKLKKNMRGIQIVGQMVRDNNEDEHLEEEKVGIPLSGHHDIDDEAISILADEDQVSPLAGHQDSRLSDQLHQFSTSMIQPQAGINFDSSRLSNNPNLSLFLHNNHPSDESFDESLIQPPLLNRQSSTQGSQRFENLGVVPSNQQSHSLNSSMISFTGPRGSNLQSNNQPQSYSQRQSFGGGGQNQFGFRPPRNFNEDQSAIMSGGGLPSQQAQIENNSDILSNESFAQHFNGFLNISQGYNATNQSQIQQPSFLSQSVLDHQSTSMHLFSSSRRRQMLGGAVGYQDTDNIPEVILEESVSYIDDEAPQILQNRSIALEENDCENNHQQQTLNQLEANQSEESKLYNSVERESKPCKSDCATETKIDCENLDLNESFSIIEEGNNVSFKKGIQFKDLQEDEDPNASKENTDQNERGKKGKQGRDDRKVTSSSLKKGAKSGTGQNGDKKRVTIMESQPSPPTQNLKLSGKASRPQIGTRDGTALTSQSGVGNFTAKTKSSLYNASMDLSLLQQHQNFLNKKQAALTNTYLTSDGSLLVYYITNLLVMTKFEDSLKIIEQFGMQGKLETDSMCQANLKKLQAYALYSLSSTQCNHKEVKAKYEEAFKLFASLKSSLGQAVCSWALGFLLYSHKEQFVTKTFTENKVFDMAKKQLEEAIKYYSLCHHNAGESHCHRLLQFIMSKNGEKGHEHTRQQISLMTTENQLQKLGKSSFIFITGNLQGIETSLFLEVVGATPPLQTTTPMPMSLIKDRNHPRAAVQRAAVVSNREQDAKSSKLQEGNKIKIAESSKKFESEKEGSQLEFTNISNVKKKLQIQTNLNQEESKIQQELRHSATQNARRMKVVTVTSSSRIGKGVLKAAFEGSDLISDKASSEKKGKHAEITFQNIDESIQIQEAQPVEEEDICSKVENMNSAFPNPAYSSSSRNSRLKKPSQFGGQTMTLNGLKNLGEAKDLEHKERRVSFNSDRLDFPDYLASQEGTVNNTAREMEQNSESSSSHQKLINDKNMIQRPIRKQVEPEEEKACDAESYGGEEDQATNMEFDAMFQKTTQGYDSENNPEMHNLSLSTINHNNNESQRPSFGVSQSDPHKNSFQQKRHSITGEVFPINSNIILSSSSKKLKPQKKQNGEQAESKPLWQSSMRQSASQATLQAGAKIGSTKVKRQQVDSEGGSDHAQQRPSSSTFSTNSLLTPRNQAGKSSTQNPIQGHTFQSEPQTSEGNGNIITTQMTNNYVSFNITTTTTVKIEGQLGHLPHNLIVGPSLQLDTSKFASSQQPPTNVPQSSTTTTEQPSHQP